MAVAAGAQENASYGNEDPGAPGPLAWTKQEYNLGDTAYHGPSFPPNRFAELRGSVHYPTVLSGGPYPFVLILHGRHASCYDTTPPFDLWEQWPCGQGRAPIPSYAGYDYLAQQLASHGMIVVSISANGVTAFDNAIAGAGAGAVQRAELISEQLARWKSWNEPVPPGGTDPRPFGDTFVGKLDLARIGLVGHSRGGEGIVRYHVLNPAGSGNPFTVRALLAIAPTGDVNNAAGIVPTNAPMGVVLGYCDGDVFKLEGAYYYDRSRYAAPGDTSPRHLIIAMGANHNFFNSVWTPGLFEAGTLDDWTDVVTQEGGNFHCRTPGVGRRLTADQQRSLLNAYASAFLRSFLANQMRFLRVLTGDVPMPPSAGTSDVLRAYLAPDDSIEPARRVDVNRFAASTSLSTNELGGGVTHGGLAIYEICPEDGTPSPNQCIPDPPASKFQQPHTVLRVSGVPSLKQLRVKWSAPGAFVENALPAGRRDLTRWHAIQFRTAQDWSLGPQGEGGPLETPQNFSVRLTDGLNNTAAVPVSSVSGALAYPPGVRPQVLPKLLLTSVSIPVSSFAGIQLNDVRSIRFEFDQTSEGGALIADLALSDALDLEGDFIGDRHDNCTNRSNPTQADRDTDASSQPAPDGCGNRCDGDFDNGGSSTIIDFNTFKSCMTLGALGVPYTGQNGPADDPQCLESDMDDSGAITILDFNDFKAEFGGSAGTSAFGVAGPQSPCTP
jgi:hypothetical protein